MPEVLMPTNSEPRVTFLSHHPNHVGWSELGPLDLLERNVITVDRLGQLRAWLQEFDDLIGLTRLANQFRDEQHSIREPVAVQVLRAEFSVELCDVGPHIRWQVGLVRRS